MSAGKPDNSATIARLTALWALAESGLGGYMHAMKIPFTGIFVGGSAVVLICLIAAASHRPYETLIRSTLLVLLVKFLVSPHTSLPAYIAVSFQGLLGAFLLGIPGGPRKLLVPLFTILAMLESALQKFILATILFGKTIWEAIDKTVLGIAGEFGITEQVAGNFSFRLIGLYCLMYLVWGALLGIWSLRLPRQIEKNREEVLQWYREHQNSRVELPENKRRKRRLRWVSLFFILLFIVTTLFISYSQEKAMEKALYTVLRTCAILVFYLFVLSPLLQWLLTRLSKRYSNNQALRELIAGLPALRALLLPAMELAKTKAGNWRKYPLFLRYLIILTLYAHEQDSDL